MSESLLTLAASDHDDVNTLAQSSVLTDETLCDRIFNRPLSDFTIKRKMPLVSAFLSGVLIFPSEKAFNDHETSKRGKSAIDSSSSPVLQSTVPILSAFKRRAPFIMIYRFDNHLSKEEFCKVYCKVLKGNDTLFTLEFVKNGRTKHEVTILNSGSSPCAEAIYKQTKLKFLGSLGGSSTFRSHRIDIIVSDSSVQHGESGLVYASLHGSGSGQIIEVADTSELVSEDALVVTSMLLVLREQETRKNGL